VAKQHPGFSAVQGRIASSMGVPAAQAGAILAASTRRASAKAKKANPRLNRVKGAKPKRTIAHGATDKEMAGQ